MSRTRVAFFFLLLIPIFLLVYEIRTTLIDMRQAQSDVFLLNMQRASQQRLIIGLQSRILHIVEGHEDEKTVGCPACFKNLMLEKYDHKLIRKFLEENGVSAEDYYDGVYKENE